METKQSVDTKQATAIDWSSWWSAILIWFLLFVVIGPAIGAIGAILTGGLPLSTAVTVTINLITLILPTLILLKINRRALILFWLTIGLSILVASAISG